MKLWRESLGRERTSTHSESSDILLTMPCGLCTCSSLGWSTPPCAHDPQLTPLPPSPSPSLGLCLEVTSPLFTAPENGGLLSIVELHRSGLSLERRAFTWETGYRRMFHEAGMRKLRFGEVKSLTQGHTADRRQSQDSNPCLGVRSAHTHSGLCGQWAKGPGPRTKLDRTRDLERRPQGTGGGLPQIKYT